MAKIKFVMEDVEVDGRSAVKYYLEDGDGNKLETITLEMDEVTPAWMEALALFDQYSFTADQVLDQEDNVVGGIDVESAGTKH